MIIRLRPSGWLTAILIAAHGFAGVIVGLLPVPLTVQFIGVVLLFFSLTIYLGRDGLLGFAWSVVQLKLIDELNCELETKDGRIIDCTILASTFVSSYLTVLMLQPIHSRLHRSVIILPDRIEADEFRRLRILLRWKWKQPTR